VSNLVGRPDDPQRCQALSWTNQHQCGNQVVADTEFCERHGGSKLAQAADMRLYLLTEARHRTRLAQLSEYGQVETLRELIALTCRLIEQRFNSIQTDADSWAAFGPISELQLAKERLVKSATKIERNLGELLSKSLALRLGQQVIQIAAEELGSLDADGQITASLTKSVMHAIATAQTGIPIKKHPVLNLNEATRKRVDEIKGSDALLSLTEDISLQLILFERRLNAIGDDELQMREACQWIIKTLTTINKLISTAHELEHSLGFLLSQEAQIALAHRIPELLIEQLAQLPNNIDLVDRIVSRLLNYDEPKVSCLELTSPSQ